MVFKVFIHNSKAKNYGDSDGTNTFQVPQKFKNWETKNMLILRYLDETWIGA